MKAIKMSLVFVLFTLLLVPTCFSFCEDPMEVPFLSKRKVTEDKLSVVFGAPSKKDEYTTYWDKTEPGKRTAYTANFNKNKFVGISTLIVLWGNAENANTLMDNFALIRGAVEKSGLYKYEGVIKKHNTNYETVGAQYTCISSPNHILQLELGKSIEQNTITMSMYQFVTTAK